MSYTGAMTIEHKILTDEDGRPAAALIPWDQFEMIQERLADDDEVVLTDEFRAELNQRVDNIKNGTTKGIPHDELMAELRSMIADSEKKKRA